MWVRLGSKWFSEVEKVVMMCFSSLLLLFGLSLCRCWIVLGLSRVVGLEVVIGD